MKLDLEDNNVAVIEVTVEQARAYFDGSDIGDIVSDFDSELDQAQGNVFTGEAEVAYVVLKVVK